MTKPDPFRYFKNEPWDYSPGADAVRPFPLSLFDVEDLLNEIGTSDRQETGRLLDNGVEKSHLRLQRRERAMLRFRRM